MKDMVAFVLALILLLLSLLGVAMRKVYFYLPAKELKRQAEAGDELARTLWRAVAYDAGLHVYLWLWIALTAGGGFLLLSRVAPWPFTLVAIMLMIWLAFAWFPRRISLTGFEARVAKTVTPAVSWQLHYLHPLFGMTLAPYVHRHSSQTHTNLYEAADLLELLEQQQTQTDNRIPQSELERAKRALTAHKYKVSDVLVPRNDVKTVSDNDTVGLVLLDELHAAGQSSFPVCQGKTDKIIGTLYLDDVGLKTEGKVRDYMQKDVRYLHEDDTLAEALQAIYKTKHQTFVVVNEFEEYVGIVTFEHILQQLTGEISAEGFDQHHDAVAVAGKHAHDDESEPEPEISEVTAEPDEVAVPEPEDDEVAGEKKEPEVDMQVVMNEEGEVEAANEIVPDDEAGAEPEEQVSSDSDEHGEATQDESIDPEEMAALDLPDSDEESEEPKETDEGKTIKFESKKSKSKAKTPESDDEVVE